MQQKERFFSPHFLQCCGGKPKTSSTPNECWVPELPGSHAFETFSPLVNNCMCIKKKKKISSLRLAEQRVDALSSVDSGLLLGSFRQKPSECTFQQSSG